MWDLGKVPNSWNEFAADKSLRSEIERGWERHIYRALLPSLEGSELKVLIFIKSRTLDWQKFAEAIPMSHFLSGVTDPDGSLLLDGEGRPYSAGTGIRKEDTVRAAIKSLEARKLITVFRAKRGSVNAANVYIPYEESKLAHELLSLGSRILPRYARGLYAREAVVAREGFWQLIRSKGELIEACRLQPGGHPTEDVSALDASELRRPLRSEWESFRVERRLRLAA